MNPTEAYDLLRIAIPKRPELRFTQWPHVPPGIAEGMHPYLGACYIATQVFCELVPEAKPYASPDRKHFWANVRGIVYDPTFDQFDHPFPYCAGYVTRFKRFSKRAQELLREVEVLTLA